MNRRLLLVLAFAALVGLVASALVYRTVLQMAGGPAPAEATEPVVVATVNMGLAETVTAQHVKVVPWPKGGVPSGALTTVPDAEGRVVRTAVVAGEPLLEAKLAPAMSGRGGIMPMLVPEGQRGVSMKVDEAIRESGFILPNSRVDVLVSMARPGSQQEKIAKVILQDVLVLAAGQTVEIRDNKPVTVTTVTLSLTPEQAERLAVAQTEGRLTLATRNLRDNQLVRTPGATQRTLLADIAPAARPAPPARRPSAPPRVVAAEPLPAPTVETVTVSVLHGPRLTEHQFVRVDGQRWVEKGAEKK